VKRHILIPILYIGLLIMGSVFVSINAISAENLPSILIIPFDIHAEKDQSFLKPAITDMLYTRLSAENRTVLVDKTAARTGPASAEDAISMAQRQNADYVLMGSITMLGAMISTDARIVDISQAKPILTFNEVGQDQSDIITHIDHLTTRINETIFGVSKAVDTPQATDPGSDDIYIHPEKLVAPGLKPLSPPAPPAPAIVVTPQPEKGEITLSYWKSEKLSADIHSMSIADIDGDGSNETVFVGDDHVYVYRYQDDRFQEIKTFSDGSFIQLIHVDTGDINQNGKAEIFLTNYTTSQQRLKSMVLEWNGQDFDIIAERFDWYLRVLQTPAAGSLLLGQKLGIESSFNPSIKESLFDRDVHKMRWQDGQYSPAGLYALPEGLSLYDFTRGDVSNNGQKEIVAFTGNDHITVYNQNGEVAWEGNEVYGGNRLFFETQDLDDPRKLINYYLPQRVHVTDLDRDGLNEIIVLKNHDAASLLSRVKAFDEGQIDCLSYDDIGIQLKWQTRKISGYISDYVIGDLNNDGLNEIVFSVVEKEKILLSKGESYIVSCMPVLK
jgi:TolB-like protein